MLVGVSVGVGVGVSVGVLVGVSVTVGVGVVVSVGVGVGVGKEPHGLVVAITISGLPPLLNEPHCAQNIYPGTWLSPVNVCDCGLP